MALAETRQVVQTNIDFASSGVMERGGMASFVPWAEGLVYYAPSGDMSGVQIRPLGIMMEDIEDLNFYRHPQYRQRNVSPLGSVVGVGVEGEFKTDFVETVFIPAGGGGVLTLTYAPGDVLFLADAGKVSKQNIGVTPAISRARIGYALSSIDSDGFLRVRLQIQ